MLGKGYDTTSHYEVARAEKFFVGHEIHGFDGVQWAFMSLDASILFWFRSWDQENLNQTWESFSTCLIRRFGRRNSGCKAEEDKTHKQILCEMVKQEEKGKREDDETGSWFQKILTSNVSLSKLSNQESYTMTNEIQTPLLKQSVVHQLAESFGHTASLALVEPPPPSKPLGVDHFEAEKKENGVSKHHKLMQELKTDVKLLKEGIEKMKSGIKELILVSRSKSKTDSGQFLISLVPCEIKHFFLDLKEKPKSTTEMEDSIKNGHTTSTSQIQLTEKVSNIYDESHKGLSRESQWFVLGGKAKNNEKQNCCSDETGSRSQRILTGLIFV